MSGVSYGGGEEGVTRPVFIYTLSDPRGNEIRYVGKTVNPSQRLRGHMGTCRTNNIKLGWIRSLRALNLKPIMDVVDTTTEELWPLVETKWISHFRSIGCRLVNLSNGGDGGSGHTASEQTRKKMSASQKGKKRSAEVCKRMSDALRGVKKTKRTTSAMNDAMSKNHPFKAKEKCKRGHDFNDTNTYTVKRLENGRDQRKCRVCRMLAQREYLARKRAQAR